MATNAGTLWMEQALSEGKRVNLYWTVLTAACLYVGVSDYAVPALGHYVTSNKAREALASFEQATIEATTPISDRQAASIAAEQGKNGDIYLLVDGQTVGKLPASFAEGKKVPEIKIREDFANLKENVNYAVSRSPRIEPSVTMQQDNGPEFRIVESELLRNRVWRGLVDGLNDFKAYLKRTNNKVESQPLPLPDDYYPGARLVPPSPAKNLLASTQRPSEQGL